MYAELFASVYSRKGLDWARGKVNMQLRGKLRQISAATRSRPQGYKCQLYVL
jgi:hypothetical protein